MGGQQRCGVQMKSACGHGTLNCKLTATKKKNKKLKVAHSLGGTNLTSEGLGPHPG